MIDLIIIILIFVCHGTDIVEGITLDLSKLTRDLYLSSNSLAKLSNMRFLKIHDLCYMTYWFNVYLPNGLLSHCLINWDIFTGMDAVLSLWNFNFWAEQLVEIFMCESKLKKLWDGVQVWMLFYIFFLLICKGTIGEVIRYSRITYGPN